MRGLKQDQSAKVVIAGHAFMQNIRRGHYELAVEAPATQRLAVAVSELAMAPDPGPPPRLSACRRLTRCNDAPSTMVGDARR